GKGLFLFVYRLSLDNLDLHQGDEGEGEGAGESSRSNRLMTVDTGMPVLFRDQEDQDIIKNE
ncbi:unnamed protein product, partial [Amoebophrya sp. A25]